MFFPFLSPTPTTMNGTSSALFSFELTLLSISNSIELSIGFGICYILSTILCVVIHFLGVHLCAGVVANNRRRRKRTEHLLEVSVETLYPWRCAGLSAPRVYAYARGISWVLFIVSTSALILYYKFYTLLLFKYAGALLLFMWGQMSSNSMVSSWFLRYIVDYYDLADIGDGVSYRSVLYKIVGKDQFHVWLLRAPESSHVARSSEESYHGPSSRSYTKEIKYLSYAELLNVELTSLFYS